MGDKTRVYVLLEAESGSYGAPKDVMGVAYNKEYALDWVAKNNEYRTYKETKFVD